MARQTYVWRDGKMIPIEDAKPLYEINSTHSVIQDTIDATESMADGKVYESKSQYYRSLKAQGYEVVGNEYKDRSKWGARRSETTAERYERRKDIRNDIQRAMYQLGVK